MKCCGRHGSSLAGITVVIQNQETLILLLVCCQLLGVDCMRSTVGKPYDIGAAASQPLVYVLGFENGEILLLCFCLPSLCYTWGSRFLILYISFSSTVKMVCECRSFLHTR